MHVRLATSLYWAAATQHGIATLPVPGDSFGFEASVAGTRQLITSYTSAGECAPRAEPEPM
jgi:hypothetical protein